MGILLVADKRAGQRVCRPQTECSVMLDAKFVNYSSDDEHGSHKVVHTRDLSYFSRGSEAAGFTSKHRSRPSNPHPKRHHLIGLRLIVPGATHAKI
jgi:hypothetical protein